LIEKAAVNGGLVEHEGHDAEPDAWRHHLMNKIWPNGKTRKEELTRRLDRAEQLLRKHMNPLRPLRYQCANHLADALGSLGKCLVDSADRALDAAEEAAAETEPEVIKRPRTFTLADLLGIIRQQRASLPADAGHPRDGWPP
jgi:hypothetical protein